MRSGRRSSLSGDPRPRSARARTGSSRRRTLARRQRHRPQADALDKSRRPKPLAHLFVKLAEPPREFGFVRTVREPIRNQVFNPPLPLCRDPERYPTEPHESRSLAPMQTELNAPQPAAIRRNRCHVSPLVLCTACAALARNHRPARRRRRLHGGAEFGTPRVRLSFGLLVAYASGHAHARRDRAASPVGSVCPAVSARRPIGSRPVR